MTLSLNLEIVGGLTLITIGTYIIAKGASQKLSKDNYLKSAHSVSDLVDTATNIHNISNTFKKNNNEKEHKEE